MNTIANESAHWVSNAAPLDFSAGPEKFGVEPMVPQIAKPTDFFGLFHPEMSSRSRSLRFQDDWIDINALPVLPPKACFPVTLKNVNTERGKILPIDIDDVDLEILGFDLWGEIPAKASFPIQLRIEKVERGSIDSFAIDDSDLEFFDL